MAVMIPRLLLVEIDGVEKTAELMAARFSATDADTGSQTFKESREGGKKVHVLKFTAVQDDAEGTIWSEIYDHPGDEVPITYMPHGNEIPSVTQPHYTQTAIIPQHDGDWLGGEAVPDENGRFTFDTEWKLKGKPIKVTAP